MIDEPREVSSLAQGEAQTQIRNHLKSFMYSGGSGLQGSRQENPTQRQANSRLEPDLIQFVDPQ
jgi:hypothetical protein